ncbi:glycosyltransferase [Nonomuraea ferruginea]
MSQTLRLLITGGGTGGHTYPALTTLTAIQRRQVPHDVLWVGTANGLEARITAEHGIPFKAITTGKLRRGPTCASSAPTWPTCSASPSGCSRRSATPPATCPTWCCRPGATWRCRSGWRPS